MKVKHVIAACMAAASLVAVAGVAHADDDHRLDAARAAQSGQQISMERAIAIAQKHVKGGRVKKAERDVEMGRLVYEIEIVTRDRKEYDIKVDAITGKIVSSRMDWDD